VLVVVLTVVVDELVRVDVVELTVVVVIVLVVAVVVAEEVGDVVTVVWSQPRNPPSAYDATAAFKTATVRSQASALASATNLPATHISVPSLPPGPVNSSTTLFNAAATSSHDVPSAPPNTVLPPSASQLIRADSEQLSNTKCIQLICA
jgi:hypothetical protein